MTRFLDFDVLRDAAHRPDGSGFAFATERGIWLQALDAERAELLIRLEGVSRCAWRPDGLRLVAQVDRAGDENYELVEVDPIGGVPLALCGASGVRCELGTPYGSGTQPYSPDGRLLAYSSNARDHACFDVIVRDLRAGRDQTLLAGDDRYYPIAWSGEGRRLLIVRVHQNLDHALFVHELTSGKTIQITPTRGVARCLPAGWSPDGRRVYLATDEGRDHLGVAYLEIASGTLHWLATPEFEIEALAVSPDGNRLVWCASHDGYSRLTVADAGGRREITALPAGVVGRRSGARGHALRFLPDSRHMLLTVATPTRPAELHLLDLDNDGTQRLTRLGARVPSNAVVPETISYHAGEHEIPALLYRPRGAGAKRRVPVVVSIHGGPEAQALPDYDPLHQELLARGIGILAPNIRGSTGYGAAYQRRIYRDWGGGDLADLESAVQYLLGCDWVAGNRLGVFGVSYGGFASLSCLTRLPGRWRAGVAASGNSDLVARASAAPPYWRRRMRDWIGDPADPSDRRRLLERSPIEHADRLTAPTLVIHGQRDTRVGSAQSDRFVARLRELGKPVEYLSFTDEGHEIGGRANKALAQRTIVDWFARHLQSAPRHNHSEPRLASPGALAQESSSGAGGHAADLRDVL